MDPLSTDSEPSSALAPATVPDVRIPIKLSAYDWHFLLRELDWGANVSDSSSYLHNRAASKTLYRMIATQLHGEKVQYWPEEEEKPEPPPKPEPKLTEPVTMKEGGFWKTLFRRT